MSPLAKLCELSLAGFLKEQLSCCNPVCYVCVCLCVCKCVVRGNWGLHGYLYPQCPQAAVIPPPEPERLLDVLVVTSCPTLSPAQDVCPWMST